MWLIGLAAMLAYALVSYLRLRRRVRASIPLRENIYVCDEVASPFILGIVRPRIYLPSALDEAQWGSVLSHERAHLARHDHWWKPLGFALLAVYWFNPLLWLAYTLLCRDIELACDERALCGMDAGQIKDYSSALLACSVPRRMIAACPLAFGEVGVGARVKNALRYKKPAFWVVAVSVVVCTVVAVCFLTNPERATMKWAKSLRVEDAGAHRAACYAAGDRQAVQGLGYGGRSPRRFDTHQQKRRPVCPQSWSRLTAAAPRSMSPRHGRRCGTRS